MTPRRRRFTAFGLFAAALVALALAVASRLAPPHAAARDARARLFLGAAEEALERDAETLRSYGFVATTNAGGAKAPWLPHYTEALRGREVILIPDNDEPGRRRVLAIARALLGKTARLVVLELDGGKDVSDWFARGHSELELIAQLDNDPVAR